MTTTNKGLIQPANGSYVDTWDQPVNNDWSYIDAAFGGVTSLNATGVSAVTLTLTQYQPMAIAISGAMSNNVTYTIPSGVGGNWIVRNTTTDATGGPWTVTFASGGGGSTVTVIRSVNSNIWSDGTNMYFSDSRPAAAAGSNTQVQYNNSGLLGGANVYYNTQGNLGVGDSPTTDTAYKFIETIGPNSTTGGAVRVRTSGYEVSGAFFNNNLAVYSGSDTAHPYILRTNAVEAMRIDTSGNVGIGITGTLASLHIYRNSTSQTALDVEAGPSASYAPAIYLTDNRSAGSNQRQYQISVGGYAQAFYVTDTTVGAVRLLIDSSGNVGIGTSSPQQLLAVGNGTDQVGAGVSGAVSTIYFGTPTNGSGGIKRISYDRSTGSLNFIGNSVASPSTQMTLDNSGNVGIGTTSTFGTKLNTSVSTVSNAITATLATGAHDCSAYIATSASGVYNFDFFGAYTASGVQYRVDGAGNVFTYGGTINTAGGAITSGAITSGAITSGAITSGAITSSGLVHSTSGGFQFPDGTIQATAATGYTPPTSVGAVGTYALLAWNGYGSPHGAEVFPGDQISGDHLTYSETSVDGGYIAGVSGTWQCMGYCNNGYSPSGVPNNATLWLRVS